MNMADLVRKIILLAIIFAFSCIGANALEPKIHTLTFGPDVALYKFKNSDFNEKGFFYGLTGSYTYRGQIIDERFSRAMLKVEGRVIHSWVKFDGELFDGNHYTVKNVKNLISEFRGLAGYDFSILSDTTITPFTGLGYYFRGDNLSRINAGYRRNSQYIYSPIGFETKTPISKGWSAGFCGEYDIFWFGRQGTYLSDLDPLFGDITNDQTKGYGMKASLKIHKAMVDKNYIFEPYVDYWNIDKSDTVNYEHTGVVGGTSFEPESTATEFGIRTVVEF